jgi:hypothetical protein
MPLQRRLDCILTKKQEGNKRMKLLEDWSARITTNCECRPLDDEGNEITPDYCLGYCHEDMGDDSKELIEEWLERNDHPSALIIRGAAMGWRRLSGYALIRESQDKLSAETLNKLMLDADFTLELKLTGRACHVVRYSHDEPTGASFELEVFAPCDGYSECQAIEGIREYEGQNLCAYCHEIELEN